MYSTFSVSSSPSNARGPKTHSATGLLASEVPISTTGPSVAFFPDPPNNFFTHPQAATQMIKANSVYMTPYPYDTVETRSTRLSRDNTCDGYRLDARHLPDASLITAQNANVNIYGGLLTPSSTPPTLYSPLDSPSHHAQNQLASYRSSSRSTPYPSRNPRSPAATQGSFDLSGGPRTQSVSRKPPMVLCTAKAPINWSRIRPGQQLLLVSQADIVKFGARVTAEDIQSAGMHPHVVMCVPRSPDYMASLEDHGHMIAISVKGKPGVSIARLLDQSARLDGGNDLVFNAYGWKTTRLGFDWPGLNRSVQGLEEDVPIMTRSKFAYMAASSIEAAVRRATYHPKAQTINDATKPWDLRHLDMGKVHLLSVNYYKKVWIPILAMDTDW
ncbi:hypothetical protein BDN70DRAFT_893429 [Pholiota conissans]|uniref:Uncharacterized protein n=1 Tax=Pholiota conissans TaxID=109636 RepID=A0A9P5Z4K7_9AGAR|nr:hypothetical protein BDN70DRAFT_893429 [Pholiota conissans]